MFSLFTQVWLWSVAAFAFGVLLTWLLFVFPQRRRSARLAAELRDALAEVDEYSYDGPEHEAYDEPFDLLDPDPDLTGDRDETHSPADTGRGWDDDPEDLRRAVTTAPYVTRRSSVAPGRGGETAATQDPPTRPAEQPTRPPAFPTSRDAGPPHAGQPRAGQSRADQPGVAGPVADRSVAEESPAEEPRVTREPADGRSTPGAEETAVDAGTEQSTNRPDLPEPPRWSAGVLDPEQAEGFSGNLRWQRPVLNGTAGEHGIEEADESGLRGSLFDPQAEPAESPPADSTQVIPKMTEDGQQAPALPRRTPGSGPRPGRESDGGGAPVVKGHSASRQYHTPASPHYASIPADVWFRTPVDAEIAGFEPWNGRRAR